ncbi:hypothetical protein [Streptomyces coeruleorubidus]
MQRGFLAGAVGGVLAMAAGGGVLTHLLAGEDVQHTTIDTVPRQFYVKVDGHPAVERTIPVRVTRVEGDPATPRVTWKFER